MTKTINPIISNMLSEIRDNFMDQRVVAASYASYIKSRIEVTTGIRNDLIQAFSAMELITLNEVGLALLNDFVNVNHSQATKDFLNGSGCYVINQYDNLSIPSEDGYVYATEDILSAYASAILDDNDSPTVLDITGQHSSLISSVVSGLSNGIALNQVAITGLEAFANEYGATQYLTRLQALLGDQFSGVSQYAVSVYDCIDGRGSVVDKVKAILQPSVEAVPSFEESTGKVVCGVDATLYQGISPASWWIDIATAVSSKAWAIYVASWKFTINLFVGIIKTALKIFSVLWYKGIRHWFITDDIAVMDDYNRDYVNIPYGTVFLPWEMTDLEEPEYSAPYYVDRLFGVQVSVDDVRQIFGAGYTLEIPFSFGAICLSAYTHNEKEGLLLQSFVAPTPIPNDETITDFAYYNKSKPSSTITLRTSIWNRFKELFRTKKVSVKLDKNHPDRSYFQMFRWSMMKLDFIAGLITSLTSEAAEEDFDIYGDIDYFTNEGFEAKGLYINSFGFEIYNSQYEDYRYVSPLAVNVLNSTGSNIGYYRMETPSEPTNEDLFKLLTNNGSGDVVDLEEYLLSIPSSQAQYALYPIATMLSIVSWIFSTSSAGMAFFASQSADTPSLFLPYRKVSEDFEFKYELQDDSLNQTVYKASIAAVAVAVVAIASAVAITKNLSKTKTQVGLNEKIAINSYTDSVARGDSQEIIDQKFKAVQKATKKANRINGVSKAVDNPAGVTSIADAMAGPDQDALSSIIHLIKD